MRKLLLSATAFVLACFSAHALDLGTKDQGFVKAKCTTVRGVFVVHPDGTYACVFAKGVVQCTPDQHCNGYPRRRRPTIPAAPPQPEYQWREYDRW